MDDDLQLLGRYARRGREAQDAFAALVRRHVDLVYGVALRTVRSPQLAEEVAQSVFTDLATRAHTIGAGTPLAAWLHLVTRRTAVDVVRRESRRQAREHAAVVLAGPEAPPEPTPWHAIEPLLDAAVESLPPADRTAILARFFENKSLREIGAALGASDDAAQKRISRALERLRDFLLRRGVTVSAAGLATELSAHPLTAAPATLTATLTSGGYFAGVALAPLAATTTQTIAWAFVPKAAAAAAVLLVAGVAVQQTVALAGQRREFATLATRTGDLQATLRELERHRATAQGRADQARASLASPAHFTTTDPAVEQAIDRWMQRVAQLRQLVATRPEFNTPELVALSEELWFSVAREARFETPEELRDLRQKLHRAAREALAREFDRALTRHADANAGRLPGSLEALAPHLAFPLEPAVLARFELCRSGVFNEAPKGTWLLAERAEFGEPHASRIFVARGETGTDELHTISERMLRRALDGFTRTQDGALPVEPAQLRPHFPVAPTARAWAEFLARPRADFTAEKLRAVLNAP